MWLYFCINRWPHFLVKPRNKKLQTPTKLNPDPNIIVGRELWTYTDEYLCACLPWMDLPFCLEREHKKVNGGGDWSSYASRDERRQRSVAGGWWVVGAWERVGTVGEVREIEQLIFLSFKISFPFFSFFNDIILFNFLFRKFIKDNQSNKKRFNLPFNFLNENIAFCSFS